MPTSSESNSEQNFLAQWMSNVSRARVILNPTFPMLETKQDSRVSLGSQFTGSLSERFLHEEHHLDASSVYGDELEVAEMGHVVTRAQMLAFKEVSAEWEHGNNDFFPDDYVLRGTSHSDPLLQKLEQLKELQQQKQEQLKRQQMEQLQRLMEEQNKLLTMVSAQQALPGFGLTSEHLNHRHGHSDSLTTLDNSNPRFPSHVYQDLLSENVHILDRFSSCLLPNVQNGQLQNLNGSDCSLPEGSRVATDSDSEQHYSNTSMKLQNDSEDYEFQNNMIVENDVCENEELELSPREDSSTDKHPKNEAFSQNCNGNNFEAGIPEDRPIVSGIEEKKQSFEEFLEEQITLEERRLKLKDQLQSTERSSLAKSVTKRPFLKRGEGIARFTNAKSKLSKSKELKLMTQQRNSEDKSTNKMDRPQMQRKIAPSSKEQVSEDVIGIIKKPIQTVKTKHGLLPNQKVAVLRNQNVKNKSSKTIIEQSDDKRVGQFSDFVKQDMNNILEANKENIMECIKHVEMGSRVRKNVPNVEQLQKTKVLSPKCSSAPLKNPEISFERSFLKRCKSWETEREKENIELDEFLLLEEAAEDISFSSNSSFVQKLLAQDQQIVKGHRMSSTPVKLAQDQQETLATNNITQEDQMVHVKTKECDVRQRYPNSWVSGVSPKCGSKRLETCSTVENPALKSASWETSEDENEEDGISNASSDLEDLETTMTNEKEEAKQLVKGNGEDNPSYRDYKGPSRNTSRENKSRDIDLDLSDRDEYSSDEATVIESKSDSDKNMPCSSVNENEFDDDKTWADLGKGDSPCDIMGNNTLTPADFASEGTTSIPDKAIKRKVASIKKGDELSRASITETDRQSMISAPPTSDLMIKLFPSLKPKQKPDARQRHETRPNAGQEAATGDGIRSQILKEKLVELETEIERFKLENASLAKLRADRERDMDSFRKEVADFEQRKATELAQIEEFKKEEMKKLQKERKVFEKHATAARAIPDKKERDEIQALKQQLADLHEELKRREARWSTTHSRLRNQIENVIKENAELREEVKVMEKVRLEVWKKAEATENYKKADINGTTMKRSDPISPTSVLKSQIPSPVPHSERSIKMTCRMHSPAKGKPSGRLKSSAGDAANSDTVKVNLAESSVKSLSTTHYNGVGQLKPHVAGYKGNDDEIQGEIGYSDGKVEKILKNGCHVILFPNGTRKETSADGKSMTVTFFNGDVKRVMPDQTVIYYFADAQTTHTTYPDGLEVLHFSNGQIEKHYPDGKKEITFPDQTVKNLFLDGREESIFPDGTIVRVNLDGSKIIEFDNGQRELHTTKFKRREYPDGTVKTVYSNGHQETKFTSGRVRVKDRDGNVIMDTK